MGARRRRPHLGGLVDTDDDSPDRPRNPLDGGLPRAAGQVQDRAPAVQDSILSLGLAIAFYYAITGYACVWYFRKELFTSVRNIVYKFVLPLLGALMLTYAFIQSAIDMYDVDYGYTVLFGIGGTFVVGVGALAIGVVLMFIWFLFPRSKRFFRGESLNRETPVMVPDEPGELTRSIDGGV